jgi:predicted deacylase
MSSRKIAIVELNRDEQAAGECRFCIEYVGGCAIQKDLEVCDIIIDKEKCSQGILYDEAIEKGAVAITAEIRRNGFSEKGLAKAVIDALLEVSNERD